MIKELEEAILLHKKAYYNDNNPTISDDEFDFLVDKLRALDPHNRVLNLTGSDIKDGKIWSVRKLTTRMGSQEKINSLEQAYEWMKQFEGKPITVEAKGDGLSIEMTYKNGKLVQAVTRGDGTEGQDITKNVLKMKNVLQSQIPDLNEFVLKGEIVFKYEDFEVLNEVLEQKGLKKFTNTRNSAGGVATSKDGEYCAYLTVMYWGVEKEGLPASRETLFLRKLGLEHMKRYSITELEELYNKVTNERDYFDFDVDGLVIKVVEPVQMKGDKPTNQIALKFPAESGVATVDYIILDPGRTGVIVPVAVFEKPVYLLGAEVTRATVGSWEILQEKGINTGAIIEVSRANDVIPKIVDVIKPGPKMTLEDVQGLYPNAYIEGAHLFSGEDNLLKRITHMFKVLDYTDISETTIGKIIDIFEIDTMWGIFDVDLNELLKHDGFGKSTVDKLIRQRKEKHEITIKTFIELLGIPGFGESRVSEFVNHFDIKYVGQLRDIYFEDLKNANGFSDILAKDIDDYITNNLLDIIELSKRFIIIDKPIQVKNVLNGLKFCITGKTSMKRELFEKLIEENNGVNTSINKADYLITNDSSTGTAKNKKARELGITIISEPEFFKQFGL